MKQKSLKSPSRIWLKNWQIEARLSKQKKEAQSERVNTAAISVSQRVVQGSALVLWSSGVPGSQLAEGEAHSRV